MVRFALCLLFGYATVVVTGCSDPSPAEPDPDAGPDAASPDAGVDALEPDASPDAPAPECETRAECAALWEQRAADRLAASLGDPAALTDFLRAVPKGGDLHNHLTGAVYAETYLGWAAEDGDCINPTTLAVVSSCTGSTQPAPTMGALFEQIIDAWSMRNFMEGAQSGHDHFFATFAKFGLIASRHRNDSIADVAKRAYSENQLYVETMFNLGTNVGSLSASLWSGTLTAADLPALYDRLRADPQYASRLASDVSAVDNAGAGYWTALGCDDISPPPACDVAVRFVAQVSRTGANDQIFGQLVSAFEMAAITPRLVAANLSSPEDDTAALNNYQLHMAMLDFLYQRYTVPGTSPLGITLHAGELTADLLPPGSTANTFHIRQAVEIGHATRIGHGLDVLSETDANGLLDELHARDVLVEICLASNDQILEVSGAEHPLAQYLAHGVPVALATDDQGVSRSSLAGEYARAALDQDLDYRTLKTMARDSLEHAFVPGPSLWTSVATAIPVAACARTATFELGDPAPPACQRFLDGSERARLQYELERRFVAFERPAP